MIRLLTKIDKSRLIKLVDPARADSITSFLEDQNVEVDETVAARIVLAEYGYDLLSIERVRRELFKTLSPDRLRRLAAEYLKTPYEMPDDNALALARKSWTHSSQFVSEVAEMFDVSDKYLPSKTRQHPAVELVEPIDPLHPLHDYQESAKRKIINSIDAGYKRFVVQLPTGAGKTRTIVESLIEYLNGFDFHSNSIVWLAHTEELCEQAIDTFKDVWLHRGTDGIKFVRCWGGYRVNDYEIVGGVVFSTFQKLYSLKKKGSSLFELLQSKTLITIVDEAHKTTAPTYKEAVDNLIRNNSILIGLTATPGRGARDSQDNKELARYFNNRLIAPELGDDPISTLRQNGVLASLRRKEVETGIEVQLTSTELNALDRDGDLSTAMLKTLAENSQRNKIIIDLITQEVNQAHPCLVFTCSVDHARLLSTLLNFLDIKSSFIDCRMSRSSRRRVVSMYKDGELDVLLNYGVLSTGFDAPRTKTVVITRPTASIVLYSQMVGRGLRGPMMGGNEIATLIDIQDNFANFGSISGIYSYFDEYWA